jgi:hypothetical protein
MPVSLHQRNINLGTTALNGSLQAGYDLGNAIVMDAAGGDFDVSGTEAISLDASTTSNFTVAGNDAGAVFLNLAVSNSGAGSGRMTVTADLVQNTVGDFFVDATNTITLNSTGGQIEVGSDADAQNILIGTGAAARTITLGNVTGATAMVYNTGSGGHAFTGDMGFFGGTPASKPTITGSRGANAALASLLTELAGLGILTDSTS